MEKGVQRVSLNVPTEIKEMFVADAAKEGLTQTQLFTKLVLENNDSEEV